jgi:S-adenosylmethionine decarboxylase proenzyme
MTALSAGEQKDSSYQFQGRHLLANYSDCDLEALSDVKGLMQAMVLAVRESGASVLEAPSWLFPPDGLTMVFLLSESHASIHTYPEHGACFVDLFTCGNHCSAEKFDASLRSYLKPKVVRMKLFVRNGEGFQDAL